jgi:hypothetical protein
MERVYRVEVEHLDGRALPLSPSKDCGGLAVEIGRYGAGLLIVDPLISAVDPAINVNQDRDLRGALEPLADATDCAVFGLAHFKTSRVLPFE